MNIATMVALVAMTAAFLWRPAVELLTTSQSRVGVRAFAVSDSAQDAGGRMRPALVRDSVVVFIFLDAQCAACWDIARSLHNFSDWATVQGIATRVVLRNAQADAKLFATTSNMALGVVFEATAWHRRLDVRNTPSILLVDRHGVIRARWLGQFPNQLAILNALGRIRR